MIKLTYYRTNYLISLILALSLGLDIVINSTIPILNENGFSNIRTLPNSIIILSILKWIDTYLWKCFPFKYLIKVPDISGRYKGEIEYEFKGEEGKKDCVLEVYQTASKVVINTYFNNEKKEETNSETKAIEIVKGDNGFFTLYHVYNNGGKKIGGVLDQHDGTSVLKYYPKSDNTKAQLEGKYYTDREHQTRGSLKVEFISKKLNGRF